VRKIDTLTKEKEENIYSILSHEYKMPLTIIGSSLDVLERYNQEDKLIDIDITAYLKAMRRNHERLTKLTNNLLDISFINTSDEYLNSEYIYLSELCDDILEEVKSTQNYNKLTYNICEEENVSPVLCDVGKTERVLLNLISNSIKYGGENVNININISNDNDYCILRFENNSLPIPKEISEKIFEPFVRAIDNFERPIEGSGLGLSIVKKFMKAHDGDIYLDTDFQNGCAFVLKFPINKKQNNTLKQTVHYHNNLHNAIEIELCDAIAK